MSSIIWQKIEADPVRALHNITAIAVMLAAVAALLTTQLCVAYVAGSAALGLVVIVACATGLLIVAAGTLIAVSIVVLINR